MRTFTDRRTLAVTTAVMLIIGTGFIFSSGCGREDVPAMASQEPALATFADGEVTQEDIHERLLDIRLALNTGQPIPGICCQNFFNELQESGRDNEYNEEKITDLVAKDIVLEQVLLEEAVKNNFYKDITYMRQMWEFEMTILVDFLEEALVEETTVSQQEALEYYQHNQSQYNVPETIVVRHIFINSDFLDTPVTRTKEKARERAEMVRRLISEGEDFSLLVQKYSDSNLASRSGGRIGPVPQGTMASVIDDAVFALQEGEVSPCIESYSGYHLFLLEAKNPAHKPEWNEIKDNIIQQLEDKKYQDRLKELKKETLKVADVTNNLDRLALITDPDDLLFRIGVHRFTVRDYMALFPRPRLDLKSESPKKFNEDVLQEVFEKALLSEASRQRGYAETPELKKQMSIHSRQLMIDLTFRQLCHLQLEDAVGEQDIRAFYDSHREEYRTDLRVLLDRITLTLPESPGDSIWSRVQAKKKLKEQARLVHKKLRERGRIDELTELGIKQWRSSNTPHEIHFFEPELREAVREKATALLDAEPDETGTLDHRVLEPLELGNDIIILRIKEAFPARVKTFEEVRSEIEARLMDLHQREITLQLAERLLEENQFRLQT